MSDDPFLGQVELFAGDFPPKGWALCQGQLLQINQNQALYSLIGITYGGNASTTFALPDLRGRVPVGVGPGFPLGQTGGQTAVPLTVAELATHNHP